MVIKARRHASAYVTVELLVGLMASPELLVFLMGANARTAANGLQKSSQPGHVA